MGWGYPWNRSGSIPGTAGWRLGGCWGSPVVSLEPLGGGWVGLGVSGSIPGTAGWRLGGVGGVGSSCPPPPRGSDYIDIPGVL